MQSARRNACARRRRASSPASAPRGPPPPPPTGPARRGVDVAATATRAGGGRASDSGIGAEMSTSARCCYFFFLQFLPLGLALPTLFPFPSMSRFRRFFCSSIISPRFVELLFCRLLVSSICGRPAVRPFCCKEPKIICWIFQKGQPTFREQEAGRSLLNS